MWFGILGHLAVRRADGSDVPIPGPARRQLLAALLCRPGVAVTAATLVEDLWGTAPPRSAVSSLRSHAARLRAALAQGGQDNLLVTEGDGYRLAVAPSDVDAGRFEFLVQTAGASVDPSTAIAKYDEALELWRGEPYVEFGDAPFAVLERIRLAELRAQARERRTDLALATGSAGELVGELEHRVRSEPYRERGWEQLALALYRSGRQADALATCRRVRQLLLDDLGVDPGPALQALEQRLLQQDPDLLVSPPPTGPVQLTVDRCPYLGLAGYTEQDAALFVGRERLTSTLAGRLADQSVVLVTGASGVGKSSLVRAGLVPALRAGALPGSAAWRIDVRTPFDAFTADRERRPDVLVLDQAEEIFTGLDADQRDELMHRLARYIEDDDGRLVVVMRSDFYGQLATVPALAPFAEKVAVLVGPLRADELRRALLEPAAAANLRLEDELVETVMEAVGDQREPLPLLSEAMVRTWQRRDGRLLTLEAYRQAGELAGAVEAAAEECYVSLDEPAQHAARHLLVRLATHTQSGWARRPVSHAQSFTDAEQRALAALVAARLVVSDDRRIEIAHEALLAHWSRLRDWLDERSLAADVLQHLDQSANDWHNGGRQPTDLYRGPRLSAAVDWRTQHPEDLSALETEFLDASVHAADSDLATARVQVRRFRTVALVLAVVLALAVAATALAFTERGRARSQAHRAEGAALAADAGRLAALSANATDIATSSLLAVAGYRLQDSAATRGALLNAVERNQSALWRMQFAHRPQRVFATADGSRLAVNDNDYDVMIIDPQTRKQVGGKIGTIGFLDGITADGSAVVANGPTNTEEPHWRVAAYDVPSGKQHILTDASGADVWYSAMTADGRYVAVITEQRAGPGSVVKVFDSHDWRATPRQFVTDGAPAGFAAGRTALAVEHTDGSVEIRSVTSLRVLARLPGRGAQVGPGATLGVSADGRYVARVDPADGRRAVLYALGRASAGTALPTQPENVRELRFGPGGSEVAVGSGSGSLAVYRTVDGAQVAAFAGHAGSLNSIAWAGSGTATALYTVGLDGDLVSWDLQSGARTVREEGPDHLKPLHAGLFGPLVVGDVQPPNSPNSTRRVFTLDTRTGKYASWPLGLVDAHGKTEGVGQISASANGTYAVASIQMFYGARVPVDREEIIDLRRHRLVGHLDLPDGGLFPDGYYAAVSPDGRRAYCNCSHEKRDVDVFALPSGKFLKRIPVHFSGADATKVEPECWQFDPAGRVVVFGWDPTQAHHRIGILDPGTGRLVAQADLAGAQQPTAIGWSKDRRLVAIASSEGSLALYDAATMKIRTAPVIAAAGGVNSVAFAPDGKTVMVGNTDGSVRFFNVPDLSPQGQRVVVGQGDGGMWAWYTADGDVTGLAQDVQRPNTDNGRWFRMVVAPAKLVAIACGLTADITRADWRRYVGDRPYRRVCSGTR